MKVLIGITCCVLLVTLVTVQFASAQMVASCPTNVSLGRFCLRCTSNTGCLGGSLCCPNANGDGRSCCMKATVTEVTTTLAPTTTTPPAQPPAGNNTNNQPGGGGQNPPDAGAQNPPDAGAQNPPDAGAQNPPNTDTGK